MNKNNTNKNFSEKERSIVITFENFKEWRDMPIEDFDKQELEKSLKEGWIYFTDLMLNGEDIGEASILVNEKFGI